MVHQSRYLMIPGLPKLFKPITTPTSSNLNMKVGDLLNSENGWNWSLINNVLWPVDKEEIEKIPVWPRS